MGERNCKEEWEGSIWQAVLRQMRSSSQTEGRIGELSRNSSSSSEEDDVLGLSRLVSKVRLLHPRTTQE
ncbi:hypothetical protein Pcinc_031536 [Petrolisthes cinctipes]|uniref:Uncharacterized protein n=1 Tax=Petrolisthes cinctipes TaxID=88211 RepID=A0AAE1K4Q0_PETCI|nr:hypothetical protein Pcinc_031536 [Petrolisthes cinctipes]